MIEWAYNMTLNEAAKYTKRILAYVLIFMVLYIFADNMYKFFMVVYNKSFPTPPNPPTLSFGKLQQPKITTLPVNLEGIEFRKELTINGFPETPRYIYVYQLKKPYISVAKEERFKAIAQNLGFPKNAKKVTDTKRLWENPTLKQSFTAEVFEEKYLLETDFNFLEKNYKAGASPSKQESVNNTRNFFTNTNDYDDDLKLAEYETFGISISEGIIKQADTPYREMFKLVSIYPSKTAYTVNQVDEKGKTTELDNKIPVFFQNPNKSSVNTIVAPEIDIASKNSVVGAEYNYYKTTDNKAYYPIINSESAWQLLLDGKASMVMLKRDGSDYFANSDILPNIEKIDIREIVLGYYMPPSFTEFLQPIYVFKGKFNTKDRETGSVYFYLPALNSQVLFF